MESGLLTVTTATTVSFNAILLRTTPRIFAELNCIEAPYLYCCTGYELIHEFYYQICLHILLGLERVLILHQVRHDISARAE